MEQNYLPLFRKYRPQSFEDVVGQESLVKALSNAIELNRIANAYLFCGPRGTGKTSSARIFAKSLNCEHGPTLKPCQKCASCIDITNATGLDVIEIDAASNRGIQDAKELISQVQYAPINGKYKIFIIDEVHMLSNDAFNALLKTFEEPPKNVIFILATTEPHKVLETIVSRCQRFDLRRITIEDIIKRLREISDKENIKITSDALYTIAKNVSGGLRDSLALLDQVSILGVKEEITKDLIEELLGKINFDVLLNLLKNISESNIEQSLADINQIYAKGNEPRNLAENFIEFLRNIVLVLNSSDKENINKFTSFVEADIEKIKNCNFDKDKIIKILNTIIEYYKEIKVSTNPYLWMELASIASCKLDLVSVPLNQMLPPQTTQTARIQQTQQIQQSAIKSSNIQPQKPLVSNVMPIKPNAQEQVPKAADGVNIIDKTEAAVASSSSSQESKTPQTVIQSNNNLANNSQNQDGAEIWMNIVHTIQSLPARAFYSGVAKLVRVGNNKITLGFLHENALIQAKSQSKYEQLENALKATYSNFSVEFIKIDSATKVVELKPRTMSSRPVAAHNPSFESAKPAPIENIEQKNIQQPKQNADNQQAKTSKKHHCAMVQSMIEQFSGKLIED